MNRLRALSTSALAATLFSSVAQAGFTNPYVPPFRGTANTQYAYWESFTVPFGGVNLPDDPQSTATQARVEQLLDGAIITGGGNIYHPTALASFRFTDTVPADLQEVDLQISTWGSELVYPSAVLNYVDAQGQPQSVAYTSYLELARAPGMGVNVESLYKWDVSSIASTITSYTITFQAAAQHLSLDAVVVDTRFGSGGGGTFVPFCYPGRSGVRACPCNNPPTGAGRGCDNFGGAPAQSCELTAAGSASIAADTLTFTSTGENNTSLTIFLQGPSTSSSGVPFGAGVRCVTGSLKRLYIGNASAGAITRPQGGDPSVHARSAALGDALSGGSIRFYFPYYRDPSAAVACSNAASTFNCGNAGKVTWAP